jgi:hypothetical protein
MCPFLVLVDEIVRVDQDPSYDIDSDLEMARHVLYEYINKLRSHLTCNHCLGLNN